jgi:hypothetical protein
MEFPEERGSHEMRDPEAMPKHIMESAISGQGTAEDRPYADDVVPLPMAEASDRLSGDVISLDSMRDNLRGAIVTNFEQDDLDVPAFLRKRNEVM